MSDTLVLLTSQFPFGKSETFLENEIPYLAKAFKNVFVLSLDKADSIRNIPYNVKVLTISDAFNNNYNSKRGISKLNKTVFSVLLKEYFRNKSRYPSLSSFLSYALRLNYKVSLLKNIIVKTGISSEAIFYSYWFEEWATILSILKLDGTITSFLSRAHGFDLYEERTSQNFIPFRRLQLEQVKQLHLISHDGLNYILTKYPQFKHKYKVSYLGVHDHGLNSYLPEDGKFVLISCSNVVPVKRVDLIAKALKHVDFPVRWVHFGDGPLMENLRKESEKLPSNIEVDFKGRISNSQLMSFYKCTPVSLFINVSASEGLPVSIMEAISFGIPVIATDVGGTCEIVNDITGILLKEDVTAEQIADSIKLCKTTLNDNSAQRNAIRNYWKGHFNAAENYQKFAHELKATTEN